GIVIPTSGISQVRVHEPVRSSGKAGSGVRQVDVVPCFGGDFFGVEVLAGLHVRSIETAGQHVAPLLQVQDVLPNFKLDSHYSTRLAGIDERNIVSGRRHDRFVDRIQNILAESRYRYQLGSRGKQFPFQVEVIVPGRIQVRVTRLFLRHVFVDKQRALLELRQGVGFAGAQAQVLVI